MKKQLIKTAVISSILSFAVYAAIDFSITSDSNAQSSSSLMSTIMAGFSSYTEIQGAKGTSSSPEVDTMAEEIALTQIAPGSSISSIDLNAKFAALVIMNAKLRCELQESGVWDDSSTSCKEENVVCADYTNPRSCEENRSLANGASGCTWLDIGEGNFECQNVSFAGDYAVYNSYTLDVNNDNNEPEYIPLDTILNFTPTSRSFHYDDGEVVADFEYQEIHWDEPGSTCMILFQVDDGEQIYHDQIDVAYNVGPLYESVMTKEDCAIIASEFNAGQVNDCVAIANKVGYQDIGPDPLYPNLCTLGVIP